MILSSHQQVVLNELVPVVQIATDGSRCGLPLTPRCHSLIIGQSGSGKSFIAREIGRRLRLPVLSINVATWILTASRNEPSSWTQIVEWLCGLREGGGLIIIDEIDKINGSAEYSSSVRLELHDLLDAIIPISAKLPGPSFDLMGASPNEVVVHDRECLERSLRERVMILGCGAWQSAWRSNTRQLGFSSNSCPVADPPSSQQILSSIDPELRQRFRDQVVILSQLVPSDYLKLARSIAKKIPQEFRNEWDSQVGWAMRQAAEGNLGMRVFEELLLKSMVLSRKSPRREHTDDAIGLESQ